MKDILIFAGTTEGRKLSERLSAAGISSTVCVATEYGEIVLKENPLVSVKRGRMDADEMRAFMEQGDFLCVVDATHPYADIVSANIKEAVKGLNLPYFRLLRERGGCVAEGAMYFESIEECVKELEKTSGNILLTTGSKELGDFAKSKALRERLFARVLPSKESIEICESCGLAGKQIICMQGPFSKDLNTAMLKQYDIKYMVTKESGKAGGFDEKIEAAIEAGAKAFVIGKEKESHGLGFSEVLAEIAKLSGKEIKAENTYKITLAGIGMGNKKNLTIEVFEDIEDADIILGAERMIEGYKPRIEAKPYYLAKQIIPYLEENESRFKDEGEKSVVVLFSGDSGFNSGATKLYKALNEEISLGKLSAYVEIMPGISSISYLAAKVGESYEDARILSIHGKEIANLGLKIKESEKTFLLMSGVEDVNRLGEILEDVGLNSCKIFAGLNLSYENEEILELSAKDCKSLIKEGLYVCFIKNENVEERGVSHGLPDSAFIRDKVPMTKEEVREASISKLHLRRNSVVYDIGSGTGSIAIEMAALSDEIKVYAIERKPEAVKLIGENKRKFKLENIEIIKAYAPEGLEGLPKASHAFIGGSGGNLKEILESLRAINPKMRVVLNAISLETIAEIKDVVKDFDICEDEIVQMQISRAKKVGDYNLMQAENPIWICSFTFKND